MTDRWNMLFYLVIDSWCCILIAYIVLEVTNAGIMRHSLRAWGRRTIGESIPYLGGIQQWRFCTLDLGSSPFMKSAPWATSDWTQCDAYCYGAGTNLFRTGFIPETFPRVLRKDRRSWDFDKTGAQSGWPFSVLSTSKVWQSYVANKCGSEAWARQAWPEMKKFTHLCF